MRPLCCLEKRRHRREFRRWWREKQQQKKNEFIVKFRCFNNWFKALADPRPCKHVVERVRPLSALVSCRCVVFFFFFFGFSILLIFICIHWTSTIDYAISSGGWISAFASSCCRGTVKTPALSLCSICVWSRYAVNHRMAINPARVPISPELISLTHPCHQPTWQPSSSSSSFICCFNLLI